MRLDLVKRHFNFPAFVIEQDQFHCWGRGCIEPRRRQSVHLGRLTQPLIGHPILDHADEHRFLHRIDGILGWMEPGHITAIFERIGPMGQHGACQRREAVGPFPTDGLPQPSSKEPALMGHQHACLHPGYELMSPMHLAAMVGLHVHLDGGMASTFQQEDTAHLWIGSLAILIATASKRLFVDLCIGC